jgi:hypothetical protein
MKSLAKLCTVVLVAVLALALSSPSTAVGAVTPQGEPAGAGILQAGAGTYSAVMQLGGGFTFTALTTLHADGTAASQDVSDFGAASVAGADTPHLNSVAVGTWKHTGGRSFVSTLIYFRSDVDGSGEVDSLGRITLIGTFDEGFHSGTGDAIVENFPCVPATIGCPDPALLPPPTAPVFGSFALMRIIP